MRVYLDSCGIQRPLDTQSHIRITLEAEAVLGIITFCDEGKLELITSDALEYETAQNPFAARRDHAEAVLAKARVFAATDEQVEKRAEVLVQRGVKLLDALHLALAETAQADYFCTCDDRFLRRIKQMSDLQVKPVSPLELIEELPT